MNWDIVHSKEQYLTILEKSIGSSNSSLAVFKHSLRCSISLMVKDRLKRFWNFDIPIVEINVLSSRELSDFIAESTQITHESPQLILFKNGKVIYHASHSGIDIEEIKERL